MELNWKRKTAQIVVVTPEIASAWGKRNTLNRPKRAANLRQYSDDMKAGRWVLGTDAIGFDTNGVITNGQHRLWSVQESGVPCEFVVVTGLDPKSRADIDTHGRRSVVDGAMLTGRQSAVDLARGKNVAAGMWARMFHGASNAKGTETRSELYEFMDTHKEAGEWTLEQFNKYPSARSVVVAPVMAAVARAYYHFVAERDELARFVQVLVTGMPELKSDGVVIRYRNLLIGITGAGSIYRGNSNKQATLYRRTTRVICAFMDGEDLQKFYDPDRELFPLPGDPVNGDTVPVRTGLPLGVVATERRPRARGRGIDRLASAEAH